MPILNILIILGCLVGGYWLVSSIMGPGVDMTRSRRDSSDSPASGAGSTKPGVVDVEVAANPHERDWHLILDVPANADRREIERAFKHRLAKAKDAGDPFEEERVRRAYAAALLQVRV